MKLSKVILFLAFVAVVVVVALSQPVYDSAVLSQPAPSGGPCIPITSYGADNTGIVDATAIFQFAANNNTTNVPGACVSLPAGTYTISKAITELCPPRTGGVTGCTSWLGNGAPWTTINQTNPNADVFDSCPTATGAAPDMPVPSPCPSATAGLQVFGAVFRDFTINYVTPAAPACTAPCPGWTGNLAGWGPSAFWFPSAQSVQILNVPIYGAYNCFDFGEDVGSSFGSTLIDGSGAGQPGLDANCTGHELAFHGGSGKFTMRGVEGHGGRGTGNSSGSLFQAVGTDTSDINGTHTLNGGNLWMTTLQHYDSNYIGGTSIANFLWMDYGVLLGDTDWTNNICDGNTMACYLFDGAPNLTASRGSSSHISICDKWSTNWYTGIMFDGAGYAGSTGGPKDIAVCTKLITGASTRGRGSSIFFVAGSPAPGGFSSDGSGVSVSWSANGSIPAFTCTATAAPGDNMRSLMHNLITQCGTNPAGNATANPAGAPVQCGDTPYANPYIASMSCSFWASGTLNGYTPMPQGNSTPVAYTVFVGGPLVPVDAPSPWATCSPPPALGAGGQNANPVPCYTGWFDNGDGIKFRNNARGERIFSGYIQSNNNCAVNIEPNSGNQLYLFGNSLAEGPSGGTGSYYSLCFPATSPPTEFYISGNDMMGSGCQACATPSPTGPVVNLPAVTFSKTSPVGYLGSFQGLITGNSGLFAPYGAATALPTAGPMWNTSPYNCYVSIQPGTSNVTGLTINGNAQPTPNPSTAPWTIFVPHGNYFSVAWTTSTPNYMANCGT